MKAIEAKELLDDLEDWFTKNGLPINVRNGSNEAIAKHICKIAKAYIHEDEPIGVIRGTDYDRCPSCNGVAGQSAYYCKLCGAKLRAGGRERG